MERGVQKIVVFADNVLIYLSTPTTSFPALMSTLTDYGQLSGYKLNVRKTQVFTFNYRPAARPNHRRKIWNRLGIEINEVSRSQSTTRLMSTKIHQL